ncbi:MAG: hypothetical protein U0841_31530 [Chloroflexia bacterium]
MLVGPRCCGRLPGGCFVERVGEHLVLGHLDGDAGLLVAAGGGAEALHGRVAIEQGLVARGAAGGVVHVHEGLHAPPLLVGELIFSSAARSSAGALRARRARS